MTLEDDDRPTGRAPRLSFDDALRALTVFDVNPERAGRTKARCVARLRASAPPGWQARRWNLLEPIAALGVSALYLAAALQAATLLLLLR
jgi:hypothetical protein